MEPSSGCLCSREQRSRSAGPDHGVACPATRLVAFGGADEHHWIVDMRRLARDQALRACCGLAAATYRRELLHDLGTCDEPRHRAERLTSKVQVQPGQDDALSPVGQPVNECDQVGVEELSLVDGHYLRIGLE